MKKIYFLAATLLMSAGVFAQTNLGFESWTNGNPDGWTTYNAATTIGDVTDGANSVIPAAEETTGATEGSSFLKATSFNLTNSTDVTNYPNGNYGSRVLQVFASTDKYEDFSFDVTYDIQTSDTAVIVVQAFDANNDLVGQGYERVGGSQTNFTTLTIPMSYTGDVAGYLIVISSSEREVFNTSSTTVPGSWIGVDNIQLGNVLLEAPNVSNVVASDISNNGDGTDLRVTFDVPADESNITAYYAVVFETGVASPGMAADPAALMTDASIATEITPNGSNQTVNFTANDFYLTIVGNNFVPNPIVEDVSFTVYIYTEGANGHVGVFASSNEITLTSPDIGGISDNVISVTAYPNPAADMLTVSMSENASSVSVISMDGKVVATQEVNGTEATINVSSLNSGVYFYEVATENGNIVRKSFVKK